MKAQVSFSVISADFEMVGRWAVPIVEVDYGMHDLSCYDFMLASSISEQDITKQIW